MEPNQSSSSGSSAPTVDENELEKKRAEILQKIIANTDECEELWGVLCGEQQSCCELISKQTFLSERFTEFHEIWRSIDFEASAPPPGVLQEINAEVTRLSNVLVTFENRTQTASTILRDITGGFSRRLQELREAQAKCLRATQLDVLDLISIPDMSGLLNIPYPDLAELNADWEELKLEEKLDKCFEDFENLNLC